MAARRNTWRMKFAPIIAELIRDNKGKPVKELRKILRAANPGYYKWPRKIWGNESLRQLGLRKRKRVPGIALTQLELVFNAES